MTSAYPGSIRATLQSGQYPGELVVTEVWDPANLGQHCSPNATLVVNEPARRIDDYHLVLTNPAPSAGPVHFAIGVADLHRDILVRGCAAAQPLARHPGGYFEYRINVNRVADKSQGVQKGLPISV